MDYFSHLMKQTGMVIGPDRGLGTGAPEGFLAEGRTVAPLSRFHPEVNSLVELRSEDAASGPVLASPEPHIHIKADEPAPEVKRPISVREVQSLTMPGITVETKRNVKPLARAQEEHAPPAPAADSGGPGATIKIKSPEMIDREQVLHTTLQQVRRWVAITPEIEAEKISAVDIERALNPIQERSFTNNREITSGREAILPATLEEPGRSVVMIPELAAENNGGSASSQLRSRQREIPAAVAAQPAAAPNPSESQDESPPSEMQSFLLSIGTISLTIEEPREETRHIGPAPPSLEKRTAAGGSRSRLSRHYLRIK